MKIYLISYDLRKPGQNYTPLYDAIKAYRDWQHPMESLWAVYTDKDANAISDDLREHIDENDCLLVVAMDSEYQGWLPKSFWTWVNERKNKNV